jgi:hypothetical protein
MPWKYQDSEDHVLVCVPVRLIGVVSYLLSYGQWRKWWDTDDDYRQGWNALADLQRQMMNNCLSDLIAEIRALRGVRAEAESIPPENRTIEDYYSLADLLQTDQQVANDGIATRALLAELGALIATALGFHPSLGSVIAIFLPRIGAMLQQVNQDDSSNQMDELYQLPIGKVLESLRGATLEPDEPALLDQVKDFLKG